MRTDDKEIQELREEIIKLRAELRNELDKLWSLSMSAYLKSSECDCCELSKN